MLISVGKRILNVLLSVFETAVALICETDRIGLVSKLCCFPDRSESLKLNHHIAMT